MRIFSRPLQVTFYILALSFFSSGKILADLPSTTNTNNTISSQLLAQKTSSSENDQVTISPPLSPEQRTKIQAINEQYKPKLENALKNYNQSIKRMEDLIGTNPPNTQIRSARKSVVDNEMDFRNLAFERIMEIRQLLTPEQTQSFAKSVREAFDKEQK